MILVLSTNSPKTSARPELKRKRVRRNVLGALASNPDFCSRTYKAVAME
jgi:hypothetical protein